MLIIIHTMFLRMFSQHVRLLKNVCTQKRIKIKHFKTTGLLQHPCKRSHKYAKRAESGAKASPACNKLPDFYNAKRKSTLVGVPQNHPDINYPTRLLGDCHVHKHRDSLGWHPLQAQLIKHRHNNDTCPFDGAGSVTVNKDNPGVFD